MTMAKKTSHIKPLSLNVTDFFVPLEAVHFILLDSIPK